MRRPLGLVFFAAALLACQPASTDTDAGNLDAGVEDAGLPDAGTVDAGTDAGTMDAGDVDGGDDAGAMDAGADCTGACAVTDLSITFHGVTAGFDRAQHGVEPDGGLYVEAYFGGDPACPGPSSPTPDRTLVIAGLHAMPDGGVQTMADGLRVTFLDFAGTLSSSPFDRAVAAQATVRASAPGALVSFTLDAAFDGGAVTGGFAAAHCASLDGP